MFQKCLFLASTLLENEEGCGCKDGSHVLDEGNDNLSYRTLCNTAELKHSSVDLLACIATVNHNLGDSIKTLVQNFHQQVVPNICYSGWRLVKRQAGAFVGLGNPG